MVVFSHSRVSPDDINGYAAMTDRPPAMAFDHLEHKTDFAYTVALGRSSPEKDNRRRHAFDVGRIGQVC